MDSESKPLDSNEAPPFDPDIVRQARDAFDVFESNPLLSVQKIRELCVDNPGNALLFRTQAEILKKCSNGATDVYNKERIMNEAIGYARRATTLRPSSMIYSCFLGYLLYQSSDNVDGFNSAIEQFSKALSIPRSSDPAQETLFTHEEIQLMSPTYEERINDARKLILRHIGDCLYQLKELGEYREINRCLNLFKEYTVIEKLYIAWPLMTLSQKRYYLREYPEGTVPTLSNTEVPEVQAVNFVPREAAQVEAPGAEESSTELPETEYSEIGLTTFRELMHSGYNQIILTGKKVLRPSCYVHYIIRLKQEMSKVILTGPMALILVADEEVEHTISLFEKKCKTVRFMSSFDLTGSDVVVTTVSKLGEYVLSGLEDTELEDVRVVIVDTVESVFTGSHRYSNKCIFEKLKAAQIVLINSVCSSDVQKLLPVLPGESKILDLQKVVLQ